MTTKPLREKLPSMQKVKGQSKLFFKFQQQWSRDFNPLYTGNPKTDPLANSEDPDEMQHHAVFN